ncbi:MAG: hypothetical protein GWN01_01210 [Nitrosopumilaceae archaeon]|nr:hypothetical protein [Nitrosopumilaceae archaeon]NIU85978.1 hypothetical protein [Nitrosopumilaceae archaeon]NIX60197.1 hypothetical protein [Nitrosopumilaceae archaeon]
MDTDKPLRPNSSITNIDSTVRNIKSRVNNLKEDLRFAIHGEVQDAEGTEESEKLQPSLKTVINKAINVQDDLTIIEDLVNEYIREGVKKGSLS